MAFPSYSGPLKNPFNDVCNEDDEFGDFTSAVTFPSIGSCNGEVGYQVTLPANSLVHPSKSNIPSTNVFFNPIPVGDNDDEFGDFCGPSVDHSSEISMVVPVKSDSGSNISFELQGNVRRCQPNYDINLEEDITGVSRLSWIGQKEEDKCIEEEEEEFTNFASAEPICPCPEIDSIIFSASQEIAEPLEKIFSTLGVEALDLPSTLQSVEHVNDSMTDDEFGDFTQASSVAAVNTVMEDLFSLDAVPPFPLESPGVLNLVPIDSCFEQQDEMQQRPFSAIVDVVESVSISWEKPLEIVDKSRLSEDVKIEEGLISEIEAKAAEEEEEFVFHQNVETIPDLESSYFQTEPTIDVPVEDDGLAEEFGDFSDFQTATCEAVAVAPEDDDFDDFEIAGHPSTEYAGSAALPATTPETHIQRMLTSLFPVHQPSVGENELQSSTIPLPHSPGGSLWSYVSQLDSTPALSFSWRHSVAQQRFLHCLRIDSVLQAAHAGGFRWNSPPSSNSSTSMSESLVESTVTLDLDFFLNPSTTSSATSNAIPANGTATNLSTNTADSLLETIERQLLSHQVKGVGNQVVAPAVQSPALAVRHNNHQLSDIFQHLHLQENANHSSATNRQIDLLQ